MGCFTSCFAPNFQEPQHYFVNHFNYNLIYDSDFETEIINDNCNYMLPLNYSIIDARYPHCD